MAKMPNTKDWKAWENRQPSNPPGPELHVTGKVETVSGALIPVLRPTVPQGINPVIRMLDLSLQDCGLGTDDIAYRDIHYYEAISFSGFSQVQILWDGEVLETIDVDVVEKYLSDDGPSNERA